MNNITAKVFNLNRLLTCIRAMSSSTSVSVKIKQGTVVGQKNASENGDSYYAFKGIPYAEPPLGELRFKSPKPLEKFATEVLDCSQEGSSSFHKDPFTASIVGSEDCLFLNVYTPKLKSEKPLPVMVWIHGGAFLMGSGNSDFHLPISLIKEDVIVVTLNYRLGIFGFLQLPDGDLQGNAGLKDQLLALQWVNENISQFNGDPSNVTLFGQSAGSAAIHLHILSDKSKKYFHKAICQSGTSIMEWVMQKSPFEKTRRLAQLVGCKSTSDPEIAEFLMNQTESIDVYKHLLNTLTPDERRRGLPMPFKPVIETESSKDAIITKPPLQAMSEPNAIQIPVLMGYTSCEGMTMLANAIKRLGDYDKDLARMIPRSINLEPDNPLCLEVAKEMRDFYFDGKGISKDNLSQFCDLLTDYHFNICLHVTAEIHARKQQQSPLYFYKFSYEGNLNLFKKWFNLEKLKGACHGDELFYLFQLEFMDVKPAPGSRDELMVKQMCRLWTNFAKYSNPTPQIDDLIDVKWDPVKPIAKDEIFELDYLHINDEIRMKKNPDIDRINFWRKIYKKYNNDFLKPKL